MTSFTEKSKQNLLSVNNYAFNNVELPSEDVSTEMKDLQVEDFSEDGGND